MNNKKNNSLELLKLLASYMVVFIHVAFSGYIGVATETLARFAVPFFFLISGFYSYRISPRKIRNRIKKLATLTAFAIASYTLFKVALLLPNGGLNDVYSYFSQYADFSALIKLIVFNVPIHLEYLWYLYAMLYVYAIFYFATILHVPDKVIFAISILILSLHVVLGEMLSIFGITLPGLLVRNFAVMGVPFFAMGLFVKKHEHKLEAVSNRLILISIVVGIGWSVVSRYFFGKKELYLGSLFILFALVCVFIKYSTIEYPKFFVALEGCSTYIYIFHDMISKTIRSILSVCGDNISSSIVLKNLHPLVVCVCSTAFAYLIIKILGSLPRYKKTV